MSKPQPIEYKGKRYPSLSALGREFNIPISAVQARLKSGVPMDAPKMTPSEAGRMGREASGWASFKI